MSLKKLKKLYPPPVAPRHNVVDWIAYEERLGFVPPSYFRNFIQAYGDCTWFDTVRLVYTPAQTEAELDEYIETLMQKVSQMEGNIYSSRPFEKITPPLFPEPEGLMPFAIDFSSRTYCWQTGGDPEQWPIVIWDTGPLEIFENATIDGMILNWINREPRMVELFCDFNDVEPEMLVVK